MALEQRLRENRVLAQHFLQRRKKLRSKGYSAAEAQALAVQERDLVDSRDDIDRIRALVGAGVPVLKAVGMVEPLRVLDEEIAKLNTELEQADEQLSPIHEQVEGLQDWIKSIYDDIQCSGKSR